jgi:hypothetical protein
MVARFQFYRAARTSPATFGSVLADEGSVSDDLFWPCAAPIHDVARSCGLQVSA